MNLSRIQIQYSLTDVVGRVETVRRRRLNLFRIQYSLKELVGRSESVTLGTGTDGGRLGVREICVVTLTESESVARA